MSLLALLAFALLTSSCQSTHKPVPSEAVASMQMARGHLERQEYDLAIQKLSSHVRKHPDIYDLQMLAGLAYLANGELSEAEGFFKQAHRLDTHSEDAQLNLAYTFILSGKHQEARQILQRMIKRNRYPRIEKVYINYGLLSLHEKAFPQAEKAFRKALVYDPTSPSAFYNLGLCAREGQRFEEAAHYFKKSLQYCQFCLDPTLAYLKALMDLGREQSALQMGKKFLESKVPSQKHKNILQRELKQLARDRGLSEWN